MEAKTLTSTDRQLLLYDIFKSCEQISFEEITSRLPVGRKMIQRDIRMLTDAGLICVRYSRKDRAYVHSGQKPVFQESAEGRYRTHLLKLRRIATLMTQLYMVDDSYYFGDSENVYTCKMCYYDLFPDASERMRQRDFEQLNRIGYDINYDNTQRRYFMWEDNGLREDFGVYRENGKLKRI